MIEQACAIALGLTQGAIMIPLSLYFAFLVQQDLLKRKRTLVASFFAPLATILIWLFLSFLSVNEVLNWIAANEPRRELGRLVAISMFAGLVLFALTSAVIGNRKRKHRTNDEQRIE